MAALSKSPLRPSSRRDRVELRPPFHASPTLPHAVGRPAVVAAAAAATAAQNHAVHPRPGKRPRAVSQAANTTSNSPPPPITTSPKHDIDGSDNHMGQRASKRLKTTHSLSRHSSLPLRRAEARKRGGAAATLRIPPHREEDRSLTATATRPPPRRARARAFSPNDSSSALVPNGVREADAHRGHGSSDDDDDDDDGDNTASRHKKVRISDADGPGSNGTRCGESDKRMLRSHDGVSRSKSELSLYFPNYEDLINNEPRATELLSAETRIFVTEEAPKSPNAAKTYILASPTRPSTPTSSPTKRPATPKNPTSLRSFQKLDFSSVELPAFPPEASDPLPSPMFHKAHRRAERQEKQLRNIEKERAQHEKVQLERLLEGLQGPDWLRVMGISGVTEGERRTWEGKRNWCLREVRALIEKFRLWKEEERRRKAEKEQSIRDEDDQSATTGDTKGSVEQDSDTEGKSNRQEEEDDEREDDDDNVTNKEEGEEEDEEEEEEEEGEEAEEEDGRTTGKGGRRKKLKNHRIKDSVSDDVDALAALQLHTENLSAKRQKAHTKSKMSPKRPDPMAFSQIEEAATAALERPFVSFFEKRHQRTAALQGFRRTGRTRIAFGQPIPELEQRDFVLPQEFLTDEARRASARSRRRQKRNTKTD